MPIAGMSFSHFLASSRMKMPNSVGGIHAASQPMRNNFSRKAPWFTTALAHQAGDDRLGRMGWGEQAEPGIHAHVRHPKLGGGRHIGEHRMPPRPGLGEDAQRT